MVLMKTKDKSFPIFLPKGGFVIVSRKINVWVAFQDVTSNCVPGKKDVSG